MNPLPIPDTEAQPQPAGPPLAPGQRLPESERRQLSSEAVAEIQALAGKFPDRLAATLPALYLAQKDFGFLSLAAMQEVARVLAVPEGHVFGVATFYTMFQKQPVGKYHLQVCTNLSCALRRRCQPAGAGVPSRLASSPAPAPARTASGAWRKWSAWPPAAADPASRSTTRSTTSSWTRRSWTRSSRPADGATIGHGEHEHAREARPPGLHLPRLRQRPFPQPHAPWRRRPPQLAAVGLRAAARRLPGPEEGAEAGARWPSPARSRLPSSAAAAARASSPA